MDNDSEMDWCKNIKKKIIKCFLKFLLPLAMKVAYIAKIYSFSSYNYMFTLLVLFIGQFSWNEGNETKKIAKELPYQKLWRQTFITTFYICIGLFIKNQTAWTLFPVRHCMRFWEHVQLQRELVSGALII